MYNNYRFSLRTIAVFAFVVSLSVKFSFAEIIDVATIGGSIAANDVNRNTARQVIQAANREVNFIGNNLHPTRPTFARSGTTFRHMHLGRPQFNDLGFVDYENDYDDISFESVVIFGGYNDAVQAVDDSDMVQNALNLRLLIEEINQSWDVDTIAVVELYDLDYDNDPNFATRWESKQGNVDRLNGLVDELASNIANVETIEINQFLEPSDYRVDGIHLNAAGQTVAGQQIGQALLEFQSVPEPSSITLLSLIMTIGLLRSRR